MRVILVLMVCMLVVSGVTAQDAYETLPLPYSVAAEFQLSPDGNTLAVYQNWPVMDDDADAAFLPMILYDLAASEIKATLSGYSDYVADVAFSPDGTQMVTFHLNGDLVVWNTADYTMIKTIETTFAAGGRIDFTKDGTTLVMLSPGTISRFLLWDIETETIKHVLGPRFESFQQFRDTELMPPNSFNHTYIAFAVAPDGSMLAVANGNDAVMLWDIATNTPTIIREPSEDFGRFSVRSLAFTPDGQYLVYAVTTDEQQQLIVWDIAAQAEAASLETSTYSLTVSPDGSQVAWVARVDDRAELYVSALPELNPVKVADVPARALPFASVAFTDDQLIVGSFPLGEEGEPALVLIPRRSL